MIVDPQNDFVDGSLGTLGAAEIIKQISNELLLKNYDFVVASQDWHIDPAEHFIQFPPHCIAESKGAEFSWLLDTSKIDAIFKKGKYQPAFSAFQGYTSEPEIIDLDSWLAVRRVRQVDFCGLLLNYCVGQSVVDSIKLGYESSLLSKYTIASSTEAAVETIEHLAAQGCIIR